MKKDGPIKLTIKRIKIITTQQKEDNASKNYLQLKKGQIDFE